MLNHIVVMGRLTRDPELRYTQSQLPVVSFTVAVDRDFGGRDGGEKQTDFIDCVAWRHSGRLQMRDWNDREGNKRRSYEIVADNVYFGESKRRDEGGAPSGGYSRPEPRDSYSAPAAPSGYDNVPKGPSAFAELDDGDGELPF